MSFRSWYPALLAGAAALAVAAAGCGQGEDKGKDTAKGKPGPAAETGKEAKKPHAHSSWWCDEHGIPEEDCKMCKKTLGQLKEEGDLCEHQRAKSQCFECNPELKEKYAARYRAKYGKEPPEPTENIKKEDKKDSKDKKS
jgi:hypothetical protein